MASARLEAEDFLVIEPCAPYPPRRNASCHGLYGMIPRLRGPVDETAQTQPAGNSVGCVAPNEWMLAIPVVRCTVRVNGPEAWLRTERKEKGRLPAWKDGLLSNLAHIYAYMYDYARN